jgi:hypothetical protein
MSRDFGERDLGMRDLGARDLDTNDEHDDIVYPSALPFVLVHLACFAAI